MVGVYVAFASVLSPMITGAPLFGVEWAGPTSSGKTTAMQVAASVWGDPDTEAGKVMQTWDSTRVGIERTAAFLQHLPLFLDDTKHAKPPGWCRRCFTTSVAAQDVFGGASTGSGRRARGDCCSAPPERAPALRTPRMVVPEPA